ncbi:MAG: Crp/Fnr family transcriptional regulator [Tistlia sp.]|uniref:Crp/Fnr family transcriptional regulator n=1 Tax=Tistlia sp. TaxID=3057121 RepID=UPI0034A49DA1
METPARISVLQRVPFFAGLDDEQLGTVAREAHEVPLKKEETLFQQGEEAIHGYVLGWGRIRLDQTTPDGQNVVLRYMGPGDLIGTVAVLRRVPFPATPVALEDCLVLSWSAPRLADLMERFPKIALNAIGVIGGRLEELQARLQEVATQRVERRIASTLMRIAHQSGRRSEGGGVEIPFPVSRQDLAEMTATTLHTVSRTLSAWDQQGIVESRRSSHLVIRKPHKLVEIAEQA